MSANDKHFLNQVVGFIDGTIVPTVKPKNSGHDFWSRKGGYGINVQLLIDNFLIFRHLDAGISGCKIDNREFVYKKFKVRSEMNTIVSYYHLLRVF